MINTKLKQLFAKFGFTAKTSPGSQTEKFSIQQTEEMGKGKFFVTLENEELAFLEYSNVKGKVLTLKHTDVSDKLRGKGAGKQLIESAVAFAREQNLKVIPMCPYAKTIFTKNQHLRDVLKEW